MKINLSTVIKNIHGINISSPKAGATGEDNLEDLTVKTVCVNALLAHFPDDTKVDGLEKYNRYKLASEISGADTEIDLPSESIVKIKLLVGKIYNPTIVGRVFDALEGIVATA